MNQDLKEIRQKFIEAAGHTTQSLGAGRVIGQIFAHLYFSQEPQSLDDLTEGLGISKGSASMAVRQLEQWGALRRLWIKGDRKDYYEATDEFGKIMRRVLVEEISQRMEVADRLLQESEEILLKAKKAANAKHEWKFVDRRVRRFRIFRDHAQWLWDKFFQGLLMK